MIRRVVNNTIKLLEEQLSRIRNSDISESGVNVKIYPLAKLVNQDSINLGNSIIIDDYTLINGGQSTIIGNHVHIASFVSITGGGKLIIEDFAGVSAVFVPRWIGRASILCREDRNWRTHARHPWRVGSMDPDRSRHDNHRFLYGQGR